MNQDDLTRRWTPSREQDAVAFIALSEAGLIVTTHLLVDKQSGWWTPQVQVVYLPGVFGDRDRASAALVPLARRKHEDTGLPVVGGWTYHRLPPQGEPSISGDGTHWQTSWSVFEDILAVFPEPSRRKQ